MEVSGIQPWENKGFAITNCKNNRFTRQHPGAGNKSNLTANGSFDSLLWSTGAITASIIVEKSGIYSIRVVDFNGCDAVDSITIEYLPEKPFSAMNVITRTEMA